MRYLFIEMYEKLTIWLSIIGVPIFIFSPYLREFYYLRYAIAIIVSISVAIIAIGGMMSYLFPYIKTPKQPLKEKGIIRILYLKSDMVITQLYSWLFAAYVIFILDQVSILYNFLMLFLSGLFLGYKIRMKANTYSLEESNKKKQEHKDKKEFLKQKK